MADYVFPVAGNYKVTSPFGSRSAPTAGASTNHQGIDISVPSGTEILAAMSGKVVGGGYSGSSGNYLVVDHGGGITTTYKHLSKALAKVGDIVSGGQKIALSGNSGITTGPHLHFEVRKDGQAIDPLTFDGSGLTGITDLLNQVDTDGILKTLKENWWLVAGALVLLALLK